MSNDPNLSQPGSKNPKRPRTVGLYDRPDKPAISPAIIIAVAILLVIIVAILILFVLPH